jgi:hypothetical protein
LDEYRGFENPPPKDPPTLVSAATPMSLPNLLWNVLKGNLFPGCHIICSSRPRATGLLMLQDLFGRKVDLNGFDEKQVLNYFNLFSRDLTSTQREGILEHSENMLSICCIPAMCHFMAQIMSLNLQNTKDWRQNPETWTETMLVAIMYLLNRHHPEFTQHSQELRAPDEILSRFSEPLSKLAEIALRCTNNIPMKLIFTSQDLHGTDLEISKEIADLGVLHVFKEICKGIIPIVIENYSFLHLLFMELFAALGLVLMDPLKSRSVLLNLSGEYDMINLFLVGLMGNRNCRELVDKVFKPRMDWELDAGKIVRCTFRERYEQMQNVSPADFACLISMLYEGKLGSDADELFNFVLSKMRQTSKVDLHETRQTASDCKALLYFLKHLKQPPQSVE